MSDSLTDQLPHGQGVQAVLDCVLSHSLELTGARLGNVQLLDRTTGYLTIAAQKGFLADFLDCFRRVGMTDGSACARAAAGRQSIVLEDVLRDEEFAPYRAVALAAGFRAVQSTPLISSGGEFLGVVSTHFAAPHRPTERALEMLKVTAELAANAILRERILAPAARGAAPPPEADIERVAPSLVALAKSYRLLRRIDRLLKG
jgi:GAF domain-containing protein